MVAKLFGRIRLAMGGLRKPFREILRAQTGVEAPCSTRRPLGGLDAA